MSAKVSSNAGLHPYLRSDLPNLFSHIKQPSGRPKLSEIKVKPMENAVNTEYKDAKGKSIYYKDEVKYNEEVYSVDYDSKKFRWIIRNDNKIFALREVTKKVSLVKKDKSR